MSYDYYPQSYSGEYRGIKLYIQLHDWERGQTVRLCQINEALSDVSLVYVRGNRVVLTGGLRGEFFADYDDLHYPDRTSILVDRRNYTHLPYLHTGRLRHSSCYDPILDCVYVLGGLRSLGRDSALRACESLYMREKLQWTQLAEMHVARWSCSLAVYKSCIYIAGGGTFVVETYDPVLDKFELLPFGLPEELMEERWSSTCHQHQWLLVCKQALISVPLNHKGRPSQQALSLPHSIESAEVRGGRLLVLDIKGRLFKLQL